MTFRDKEKERLNLLKPELFGLNPCDKGYFPKLKKDYEFCLPINRADENLHDSMRNEAIKYFTDRNIGWHDGFMDPVKKLNFPSNHLCCSQSFCVNAFFPFRNNPGCLKEVLIKLGYPVKEMLPIEKDKLKSGEEAFVAFEWIGTKNYLKELSLGKVASETQRTRGKNFTSADFAFLFKRTDGKIQLVLGEWKYTEQYIGKGSIRWSKDKNKRPKTDRLGIYQPYLTTNSPINIEPHTDFSILFFDPFDQLMRLQLLAKQMELSNPAELGADIVSVMHVAPKANKDLMNYIPNSELRYFGTNIHEVWKNIAERGKFEAVFTEDLIKIIIDPAILPNAAWGNYLKTRYNF